MTDFRPLKLLANAIQAACGIQYYRLNKDGSVRPSLHYTGWRRRVQTFANGLGWMSRGYQYDDRTLRQRLTDKSAWAHFRYAFTGSFHKS